MADVFGCHFDHDNMAAISYLRPADKEFGGLVAPLDLLSHAQADENGAVQLKPEASAAVLARLTLPYAQERGAVETENWASIHSDPPWRDLDVPALTEHEFGEGRAIYSCADIEAGDSEAHTNAFVGLIRRLAAGPFAYEVDAHPCVWVNAFHQPGDERIVFFLLNYQEQLPVLPVESVQVTIRPPASRRLRQCSSVPDGAELPLTEADDGAATFTVSRLEVFAAFSLSYGAEGER